MNPNLVKFPVTWPTLGWVAIQWIEHYLVHGPGDIQGETIRLDLEECAWLCWVYRIQPRLKANGEPNPLTGRRFVHRGVYSRSKGQRKSELGGMVCCFEAFGPCR